MPTIAIPYRNEGGGKGAFFDHFTVRQMTGWSTKIIVKPGTGISELKELIDSRAETGKYGLPVDEGLPAIADNEGEDCAFIFIPGYTRDSDSEKPLAHTNRVKYEQSIIKKAVCRGQPVLAVCAGSWTMWQAYGGGLVEVADHNYGGAMPRLSQSAPVVCNNKMIHRVRCMPHTLLAGSMAKDGLIEDVAVHSVHWKAVDKDSCGSKNLQISALSVQDDDIAPNSRQGQLMKPENSIEAFETIYGVPMVGVQWHPEAFNPGEADSRSHQNLFKALQVSGMAYLNRKKLNAEIKTRGPGFFNQATKDEATVGELSFACSTLKI
jgi:gamma-glutamyl-gamma-aminobutyrate hydrolase PuuD